MHSYTSVTWDVGQVALLPHHTTSVLEVNIQEQKHCILTAPQGPWAGSSEEHGEQHHITLSRLKDLPFLSAGKKFTYFVPFYESIFPRISAKQSRL